MCSLEVNGSGATKTVVASSLPEFYQHLQQLSVLCKTFTMYREAQGSKEKLAQTFLLPLAPSLYRCKSVCLVVAVSTDGTLNYTIIHLPLYRSSAELCRVLLVHDYVYKLSIFGLWSG